MACARGPWLASNVPVMLTVFVMRLMYHNCISAHVARQQGLPLIPVFAILLICLPALYACCGASIPLLS